MIIVRLAHTRRPGNSRQAQRDEASTSYGLSLGTKIGDGALEFTYYRFPDFEDFTELEDAVNAEQPPFRVPVGKDANEVIAGRAAAGDEAWISAMCEKDDTAFADRWTDIVGVDYFRD